MTDQDVWAKALKEAESPELRDPNLWARSFAEADGDDAKARAAYVKAKVAGTQEAPSRQSHPRRGYCPSCGDEIDMESTYCTGCHSKLGGEFRPTKDRHGLWADEPPKEKAPQALNVVKMAKSRGTYVILGILLGMLGIHNFYAGRFMRGALQLACTTLLGWFVVGLFITAFWVLIDLFTVSTDGAGDSFA